MASSPVCVVFEDREEGEIVDDDFEDISDNSIIEPFYSGKSIAPKDHLPAISLSSVSEAEVPREKEKTIRHRKLSKRRSSKPFKKRRNSHRKTLCNESDSDDCLEFERIDKKLQHQLKAAIRVDHEEEFQKNSLRSRLKAMTKVDNESDISTERQEDLQSNNDEKIEEKALSDDIDNELIQLRLEALRTAVLNKFKQRKKRKMKEMKDTDILSDFSIKSDTSENNKENTHNTNENIDTALEGNFSKKPCLEKPIENVENKKDMPNNVIENNTPTEDDEDVLRALLLASMSKKITNGTDKKVVTESLNNKNVIIEDIIPKSSKIEVNLDLKNKRNFKNHIINNNILIKNQIHLPKVKPLIINVNADSDTDDDTFNKTIKDKAEKLANANVVVVNKEIESTVEKFLKEQRAKVEAQLPHTRSQVSKVSSSVSVSIPTSPAILEKSSVKLLPKVKQIEYQKLLQKLKNAERKPRVRRLSQKISEVKQIGTTKKMNRTKVIVNKQIVKSKEDFTSDEKPVVKVLHKTLKDMQCLDNGRLQMQEKYKVLTPIVKKINQASSERKRYNQEVKRLLEELSEAKNKLFETHQNFNLHVKELISRKEQIDRSLKVIAEDAKKPFTSTPVKGTEEPIASFEASSIMNQTPDNPSSNRLNGDDILDTSFNIGDPNDIDKIYGKQKNSISKYISPLDIANRANTEDPFSIICPFEVNGNCRDPECTYKHFCK